MLNLSTMAAIFSSYLFRFVAATVLLAVRSVTADRFLVVLMLTDGSHVLTTDSVLHSLTNRGHHVSLLVPPLPEEDRNRILTRNVNVEVINTFASPEVIEEARKLKLAGMIRMAAMGDQVGESNERLKLAYAFDAVCESILTNTTLMNNLRQRKYDLIFADITFLCPVLIAQRLGLRYTTLTPMIIPAIHASPHGSPINPSYIPMILTGYSDRMTFAQRLTNTVNCVFMSIMTPVLFSRGSDLLKYRYDIMQDQSTLDSLGQAEIWFINSHFALDYPRPFVPRAVLVGGLTVKPSQHLNQDLETFMWQSGEHGVVVFSFGTYMDGMEIISAQMIADAFAAIPQKVLWKKSGQAPANVSDNIKFVDWMPQNDILGHEKTRLFISHCGLNSAFEALYHAVPVLCIPVCGEQNDVAARIVSKRVGLQLNLQTLSTEELLSNIRIILQDERFQKNMDHLSSIYRDEPLMPADRVAYWMEYVVRHNGTSHLKSAGMDLNFFQYYLLDVTAFLMLCAIFVIVICSYVIKRIFRRCKRTLKAKSD